MGSFCSKNEDEIDTSVNDNFVFCCPTCNNSNYNDNIYEEEDTTVFCCPC